MHIVWMQIILIVSNNKGFQQKGGEKWSKEKGKIRYKLNVCHKDTLMSFAVCVCTRP